MTSLDASAMSPAARLNQSSAAATSNDLVKTIASAVVDLVKSEPGLRVELHRVLVAAKPDHDEMLTTHEAAAIARVAVGSARRWVRQGRLQRHRVGRTLRVSRIELECMMRDPGPERELSPEEQPTAIFVESSVRECSTFSTMDLMMRNRRYATSGCPVAEHRSRSAIEAHGDRSAQLSD